MNSLFGLYFLTMDPAGKVEYQGKVVGDLGAGFYLVEMARRIADSFKEAEGEMQVLRIWDLMNTSFYSDEATMLKHCREKMESFDMLHREGGNVVSTRGRVIR